MKDIKHQKYQQKNKSIRNKFKDMQKFSLFLFSFSNLVYKRGSSNITLFLGIQGNIDLSGLSYDLVI